MVKKRNPGLPMLTLIKVETVPIMSIHTRLISYLLLFLLFNSCFAEEVKAPVRMSLDQATKQIIENDNNFIVLGAETEKIDGKEKHVIKVLTPDSRVQHYIVDVDSSEIIK